MMDQDTFGRYVTSRYEDQIAWYDGKAIANQKKYVRLQWLVIILASVTPILIELDVGSVWGGLDIATVPSLAVAILTATLKTFKYQENWMNYRTICESLKKERYLYDAGVDEYREADDREALFVERVEAMISRENTLWISTHQQHADRPEQRGPDTAG